MTFSVARATLLLTVLGAAAPPVSLARGTPHFAPAPNVAATIRGRVTDKDGGGPVASVQIIIVGTTRGAITNNNGDYVITGVSAGQISLRATRIGYAPSTQSVTVPETGDVTANFALDRAATRLEEVITTATGEQSVRQFGNVVSSVKADSIKKIAPTTNVQELLNARTSGVQVFLGAGIAGANQPIRVRGTASLSLTNDPLMIVDGVRVDNGTVTGSFATSSSRVGDLQAEEIESIDIIKGPSAAALYGTAAANGVIVVKTKRGEASKKTRWTILGETGLESQPNKFANNYRSWGHNLSGGVPTGNPVQCTNANKSLGRCVVDSLTYNNPWKNPLTSPYSKSTPRNVLGLQISGGSDLLRYFVSGTHTDEIGPFTMPDTEVKRLTAARGAPPTNTQVHPNQVKQDNLRGNFQISLTPTATIDVNAGYADRTFWQPFDGGFFAGMSFQFLTAPGCAIRCTSTLRSDGTWTNGTQREYVGDVFSVEQKTTEQRFTGSANLNWAPLDWIHATATIGLDQSNTYAFRLQTVAQGPNQATAWGPNSAQSFSGKDFERNNVNKYSVNLGATATRQITSQLQSRTSLGAQFFKDETYRGQGQGYGFGPGVSTPNSASQRQASEFTTENATYGAFAEQQVSHRDILFATVGVRTDKNSAFGRKVSNTIYPRGSLSYVISDESWFPRVAGIGQVRLRGAVGQAGVQPGATAALQFLGARTYPINGVEQPALFLTAIGNSDLKPEITTEIEGGTEVALLHDRVNIELTLFRKISKDALFNRPLPPSEGAGGNQFQNIARVENRGYEFGLDLAVLKSAIATWDVHLNGSHLKNKLVTVGPATLPTTPGARNVVGYPINALWDRPIKSFNDANGDHIITENEVVVADSQAYRGPSLPEYEAGLTSTFGLFNGTVHVMTLFDYRGKFWNQWGWQNQRCVSTGNCQAINDPSAPLADQASAVMGGSSANRTLWGFFVQDDFIRFREASVSWNVPRRYLQRFFGDRTAQLVLSGRNLGIVWTKYPGIDPEANVNAGAATNDFGYFEPPIRYWIGRINVAF